MLLFNFSYIPFHLFPLSPTPLNPLFLLCSIYILISKFSTSSLYFPNILQHINIHSIKNFYFNYNFKSLHINPWIFNFIKSYKFHIHNFAQTHMQHVILISHQKYFLNTINHTYTFNKHTIPPNLSKVFHLLQFLPLLAARTQKFIIFIQHFPSILVVIFTINISIN